ncbi:hypothetical protein [Streptomyces sp. NPDC059928]|uniref:hypothetical protein n=1 Tax=unclassified Streptomyces TaxID=2593676 RepID=UPI0036533FB1
MQRILHPPRPTLREQLLLACWWVEELWCRHVWQRELYRRLDRLRETVRAARPPEWDTPEYAERSLQRLAARLAADSNGRQQDGSISARGLSTEPGERE